MHVKSNLDFTKIGLRVREIRKAAHLKPGEFGDKVGVGDRHISNVESAARHLSPELASNICYAFPQYTMDYIFRGTEVDQTDNLTVRIRNLTDDQREIVENLVSTLEQQAKK
jgi:transcriptional regulator with XRE-family HTH domain